MIVGIRFFDIKRRIRLILVPISYIKLASRKAVESYNALSFCFNPSIKWPKHIVKPYYRVSLCLCLLFYKKKQYQRYWQNNHENTEIGRACPWCWEHWRWTGLPLMLGTSRMKWFAPDAGNINHRMKGSKIQRQLKTTQKPSTNPEIDSYTGLLSDLVNCQIWLNLASGLSCLCKVQQNLKELLLCQSALGAIENENCNFIFFYFA